MHYVDMRSSYRIKAKQNLIQSIVRRLVIISGYGLCCVWQGISVVVCQAALRFSGRNVDRLIKILPVDYDRSRSLRLQCIARDLSSSRLVL